MPPIPVNISVFLNHHHVVSLAVTSGEELWAASCFYVFNESTAELIIMSSQNTRHGLFMLANNNIAGTVAGQPKHIRDICGLQFNGKVTLITDKDKKKKALALYVKAHPLATAFHTDIWCIRLHTLKYTDNKFMFAQKTWWQRPDEN